MKDSKPSVSRGLADMDRLREPLDRLAREFNPADVSPDPVELVRPYDDPRDREVAGLIASCLAYGNVRQILRSAGQVLEALGPRPAKALRPLDAAKFLRRNGAWKHRFNTAPDIARLLAATGEALRRHGRLEALFMEGFDPRGDETVEMGLEVFVRRLQAYAGLAPPAPPRGEAAERLATLAPDDAAPLRHHAINRFEAGRAITPRAGHLLPLPSSGSACKRLNLFLRWMVRPDDGVDLGVWTGVAPSALVLPLDTHVWRIARDIGLTRRAAADWKSAREITAALSRLDPRDPVRYDFALSRLGILGFCRGGDGPCKHPECALAPTCRRAAGRRPQKD